MKKIVRLTESDLTRIVKRVINEDDCYYCDLPWCKPGDSGIMVGDSVYYALSKPGTTTGPFCKILIPKDPGITKKLQLKQ